MNHICRGRATLWPTDKWKWGCETSRASPDKLYHTREKGGRLQDHLRRTHRAKVPLAKTTHYIVSQFWQQHTEQSGTSSSVTFFAEASAGSPHSMALISSQKHNSC